jgi:hypothetical protein
MSLIVVRIIQSDEIRVVSDTKITDYSAIHQTPLNGLMKCILVSSTCCVCFSGNVGLAQNAIGPILNSQDIDGDSVAENLLRAHRSGNRAADFIVAVTEPEPTIYRIAAGQIESPISSTWIGYQPAFDTYQEHYHNLDATPFDGFSAEEALRFDVIRRMSDAFRSVVENPTHCSVGDFCLTVTSRPVERDGFRYVSSAAGFGFHSVSNTTDETSLLRPLGVGGGSYNYSILTPKQSGIGIVGVHFLEGKLGALFYPRHQWAPILFRDTTIASFIQVVSQGYGITIDGIRHS